jgi:L-ascorbate metabolism protein UlaG (beta-lactamase superfamily)
MIERIQWLGNGSFTVQGPPLIYINPWRVPRGVFHADVILVSHHQYDRCSLADINKLRGPNTRIIGSEAVAREIEDCLVLRPWQSICVDRACIKAVPAYSSTQTKQNRDDSGLGFIISVNFHDIYYAGDTQLIPEMGRVRPDIAILPIGDAALAVSDAVQLIQTMRPRWVIPCNWEQSSQFDTQSFEHQVEDFAEVVILPRQK